MHFNIVELTWARAIWFRKRLLSWAANDFSTKPHFLLYNLKCSPETAWPIKTHRLAHVITDVNLKKLARAQLRLILLEFLVIQRL